MEIWKDVKGFEGRYQVSDLGRVRSLSGYEVTKAKWSRFRVGRILKQGGGNGQQRYLSVSLGANNKKLVHRLVAEAFIPNPNNYPHVNHKDKDNKNNKVSNLEWVTPTMNSVHSSGRAFSLINGNAIASFSSIAEAASFLGSNCGNVSRLLNKKKYNHIKGWKLHEE